MLKLFFGGLGISSYKIKKKNRVIKGFRRSNRL